MLRFRLSKKTDFKRFSYEICRYVPYKLLKITSDFFKSVSRFCHTFPILSKLKSDNYQNNYLASSYHFIPVLLDTPNLYWEYFRNYACSQITTFGGNFLFLMCRRK